MIRIRQVKVLVGSNNLKEECAKKLKINSKLIKELKIIKQSIDSRYKPDIYYVYEVDVKLDNEGKFLKKNKSNDIFESPVEKYTFNIKGNLNMNNRPIIVGSGPAGLFCAYLLAENGYNPLIIERGSDVDTRVDKVNKFWDENKLDQECNVQFGEGGAGTFSDGKLNTLISDKFFRMRKVFDTFILHGAPEDILYINKPHIGTDILRIVVKNMRNKIIDMGGEFRFNTKLTNINYENNKLKSIIVNDQEEIRCECLVLAIGHSARDTFKMLYGSLEMKPKSFAIGVRIQHPQKMINEQQYGRNYNKELPNASYKLTHNCKNNRGAYTFCMCPGGYVVNSSSEDNRLSINGMSNHSRDTNNANSAVIVTVTPNDFGDSPLDGIEYQRKLEETAYKIGKGNIPIQLFKDFLNNKKSTTFGEVEPVFKGNYTFANLNDIFPEYISESLKESILEFDKKIKGYAREDAILAAIESRTSSPIRIVRNEFFESNISGIYPSGEGAGYAGGITSAAIDGIKVAEAIAGKYKNKRK